MEIVSDDDDDEEEDVITLPDDKYRPQSLEKMIALIAMLVEKSRGDDNNLQLSTKDFNAVVGGGKVSRLERRNQFLCLELLLCIVGTKAGNLTRGCKGEARETHLFDLVEFLWYFIHGRICFM